MPRRYSPQRRPAQPAAPAEQREGTPFSLLQKLKAGFGAREAAPEAPAAAESHVRNEPVVELDYPDQIPALTSAVERMLRGEIQEEASWTRHPA